MAEYTENLRGLNTEQYPDRLPSGTADIALNVTVRNGVIEKRHGFASWDVDVNGADGAVLNMFVAHFANAEVYVVCKCDDGKLWKRKVYPADAGAFTELTTERTHNAADPGWFFMWADRMHYFDRAGGSRWHPDHLTSSSKAFKAGLPRPSQGCLGAVASGGEKDGYYHIHMAYANSETGEEGVVAGPQTPPVHCELVDDQGGIAISTWSTNRTNDSTYEWTDAVFYTTFGNSEWLTPGDGVECYSYRAYRDVQAPKTQTSVGLNKADHVLPARDYMKNQGGEPPGSRFGCYDGLQAVYGGIDSGTEASLTFTFAGDDNNLIFTAVNPGIGGNLIGITIATGGTAGAETVVVSNNEITITVEAAVTTANQLITAVEASAAASALVGVELTPTDGSPAGANDGSGTIPGATSGDLTGGSYVGGVQVQGRIDFSIPNFPTMVPRMEVYHAGGDGKGFEPIPWRGTLRTGTPGNIVACAAGGRRLLAFTPYSTYTLIRGGDGRLWPQELTRGYGAATQKACVGTPRAVYAYSKGRLTEFGGGIRNLSADRITPTLELVPDGQETDTVLAYYAYQDELWCAMTKAGATVAQRILILDTRGDSYWIFDPACLGATGITAMCELALPNATPTMLIATSTGAIFQYPSGTNDNATEFAAQWRGYIGQERCENEQRLQNVRVYVGSNVKDNVTFGIRALQTAAETPSQETTTLTKSDGVQKVFADISKMAGNLFQIEFASTNAVTARWAIKGLSAELELVK